jgi:type IV pilus assembly protein PilA
MRIKNVGIKVQKGFTLIELMITVAIVGILAAVALPAYQDYTIRAQVAEGFPLADGVKTAITEYYAQNGSFPASNATVGLSAVTGKYVGTITSAGTATSDVVTVTMGAAAPTNATVQGQTLTMTGADGGNGIIVWTCAKGTLAQKYLPSSCN